MRAVPLAALMLAFSPIELSAQNFALNAHATVTSEVSIARLSDLSFGAAILPGMATSVAPASGARVRVDYNEPAAVTAPDFVMIAGPAGALLRIDLVCAHDVAPAAAAPTVFPAPCAGGFMPPIAGNVGGTHYVYVGGVVSAGASASAPAGTYVGTFSVTVTYVNY
jgi:spore coat protein U-like protein